MRVSKSCEHALRAILSLIALGEERYVPIRYLGAELDISTPTLTKVLQHLSDAALLKSKRGPTGGVALARAPEAISLYDVVTAVDGESAFGQCMLGLGGCRQTLRCPMETHETGSCRELEHPFKNTSLVDLLGDSPVQKNR